MPGIELGPLAFLGKNDAVSVKKDMVIDKNIR